eukprot:TRINITY_DN8548_c0_g1_i1.p1 TRINITY_DN8548_c0_g1~~TRINITY_DN8548_c0_g1_i1.p1  ORF type:complete len:256 (+),score=47.11 TRINITY_DN8548_c0_g1_i1:55-768(+)
MSASPGVSAVALAVTSAVVYELLGLFVDLSGDPEEPGDTAVAEASALDAPAVAVAAQQALVQVAAVEEQGPAEALLVDEVPELLEIPALGAVVTALALLLAIVVRWWRRRKVCPRDLPESEETWSKLMRQASDIRVDQADGIEVDAGLPGLLAEAFALEAEKPVVKQPALPKLASQRTLPNQFPSASSSATSPTTLEDSRYGHVVADAMLSCGERNMTAESLGSEEALRHQALGPRD